MNHIKLFENFIDIESICEEFGITNWTENPDGSVDVDGDVWLYNKKLEKLPIKFGRVSGYFNCSSNKLTTLEGTPKEVGGDFDCSRNELTTLEGGPSTVGGHFFCHRNKLISLEGAPSRVGGDFDCKFNNQLITLEGAPIEVGGDFDCAYNNKLTTLEGGPSRVGGGFNCSSNKLTNLEGAPREVSGRFKCNNNPIWEVHKLFPNYKSYIDSLDYNYLRGRNIVRGRFGEALEELGIEIPDSIPGYKYI